MTKILCTFLLIATVFFTALSTVEAEESGKRADITLKTTNTVVLSDSVNFKSIGQVIREMESKPDKTIYLFLSSPGGSVSAGDALLSHLKATDKEVVCIADFAASMAFVIFQGCPSRIILGHGVIMQHQVSYSLSQQPAANQAQLIRLIEIQSLELDKMQSARMKLSVADFRTWYHDDAWLYGPEAVTKNAADKIGTVLCSKKLIKSTVEKDVKAFFGSYTATFSGCPLLPIPLDVKKGEVFQFKTMPTHVIKALNERSI